MKPGVHARGATSRCESSTRRGQVPRTATAPGRYHRSEGSNVGCSHATGCPLFPLLNASLQGWRDYYCDSTDRWQECARYKMSLTGERVPISLLPNGHHATHLKREYESVTGQSASSPYDPSSALSEHLNGHRRQNPSSGRGLWTRLVNWMSGPA